MLSSTSLNAPSLGDRTPSLTASEDTASDQLSVRDPPLQVPTNVLSDPKLFPSSTTDSPTSSSSSPLPPLPSPRPRRKSRLISVSTHPRSRAVSLLIAPTPAVLIAIKQPQVLASLLRYTQWPDFHALARTTRALGDELFDSSDLREQILTQFVPAYRYAAAKRNMEWYQDVHVSLRDLELLAISEATSLAQYPTHALAVLSALLPSPEMDERTEHLAALALAHSRFVLLLQSLIQSSPALDFHESEALLAPRPPTIQPGLRELIFPSPLYDPDGTCSNAQDEPAPDTEKRVREQPKTVRSSDAKKSHSVDERGRLVSTHARAQSASMSKLPALLVRSRSFLGRSSAPRRPPPAPLAEPAAFKYHTWRRTRDPWRAPPSAFPSPPPLPHTSQPPTSASDDALHRLPHRQYASSPGHQRVVSSSSQPFPLSYSSSSSGSASPQPSSTLGAPPIVSSPHDLQAATVRTRAPVLRVFIPCADMSDTTVLRCTRAVQRAGLWEHLSKGDVVCNLGFIPPDPPAPTTDDEEPDPHAGRTWLLFDGRALVPFAPPGSPPLTHPLRFPSPLYYAHLLPLHTNPSFVLKLPAPTAPPVPTLASLVAQVRSPHSPRGRAVVRRHAWLARCSVHIAKPGAVGPGWLGEWVVEGDGTREGRAAVLDALSGGRTAEREFEIVRERSCPGRIWLRIIDRAEPARAGHAGH